LRTGFRQKEGAIYLSSEEQSVTAIYEAFNTANLENLADLLHSDVDWETTPPGGRTRGREQVCALFAGRMAEWTWEFQPTSILTGEDGRITVHGRSAVRKKDGTVRRDQEVEHLYTMQDGLVRNADLVQCKDVA
jgi:ketosteroid isomerase-like protein